MEITKISQKSKKIFKIKRPFYKNLWFWTIIIIVCLVMIIGVPIIINESYKMNGQYITLWEASDVLSYYAVILSGIITILALIVTIHFTKKDTEKQLQFYMSQVNTPFFVIEKVFHTGAQPFNKNELNIWEKTIEICSDGDIPEEEKSKIEIIINNKGNGVALEPTYQIDMFESSEYLEHVISANDKMKLILDINKNVNDKWVKKYFEKELDSDKSTFYTYINFTYKNSMGIKFEQCISVELEVNYELKKLFLHIMPASPQKILDRE